MDQNPMDGKTFDLTNSDEAEELDDGNKNYCQLNTILQFSKLNKAAISRNLKNNSKEILNNIMKKSNEEEKCQSLFNYITIMLNQESSFISQEKSTQTEEINTKEKITKQETTKKNNTKEETTQTDFINTELKIWHIPSDSPEPEYTRNSPNYANQQKEQFKSDGNYSAMPQERTGQACMRQETTASYSDYQQMQTSLPFGTYSEPQGQEAVRRNYDPQLIHPSLSYGTSSVVQGQGAVTINYDHQLIRPQLPYVISSVVQGQEAGTRNYDPQFIRPPLPYGISSVVQGQEAVRRNYDPQLIHPSLAYGNSAMVQVHGNNVNQQIGQPLLSYPNAPTTQIQCRILNELPKDVIENSSALPKRPYQFQPNNYRECKYKKKCNHKDCPQMPMCQFNGSPPHENINNNQIFFSRDHDHYQRY